MGNNPADGTRILQQIETTADYYPPSTYRDLLQFFSDLSLEDDPLSNDFIPVSTINGAGANTKLFVVGILPPSARPTGRLLDRSATVSNVTDQPPDVPVSAQADEVSSGKLDREFWARFVSMCDRLKVDPFYLAAIIYNESNFSPNPKFAKPGATAKGLMQWIPSTGKGLGMTDKQWENLQNTTAQSQLYWVEKFVSRWRNRSKVTSAGQLYTNNLGGYNNPDGSLYASLAWQQKYIERAKKEIQVLQGMPSLDAVGQERLAQLQSVVTNGYPHSKQNDAAYRGNYNPKNGGLDRDQDGAIYLSDLNMVLANLPPPGIRGAIQDAIDSGERYGIEPPSDATDNSNKNGKPPDWDKNSEAAKRARELQEKIQQYGFNATELGEQLLAAQKMQIKAIQDGIDKMARTPPLRMLVNPNKFTVNGEKIIQDGNWTRNGPIVEHWGDNQDKISGGGKLAAFMAIDVNNANGPGLTRSARNFSASYQNFLSLWLLYKNNAGLWTQDYVQANQRNNLAVVGSIYIYYDNILYLGSFNDFNITEDDTNPFSLEYSFEFTVRAAFLLDRVEDPAFTYGAPQLFPKAAAPSLSINEPPEGEELPVEGLSAQTAADFLSQAPDAPNNTVTDTSQADINAIIANANPPGTGGGA